MVHFLVLKHFNFMQIILKFNYFCSGSIHWKTKVVVPIAPRSVEFAFLFLQLIYSQIQWILRTFSHSHFDIPSFIHSICFEISIIDCSVVYVDWLEFQFQCNKSGNFERIFYVFKVWIWLKYIHWSPTPFLYVRRFDRIIFSCKSIFSNHIQMRICLFLFLLVCESIMLNISQFFHNLNLTFSKY